MATNKCTFNIDDVNARFYNLLDTAPSDRREVLIKREIENIKKDMLVEDMSINDISSAIALSILDLIEELSMEDEVDESYFNLDTLTKDVNYIYLGGTFNEKSSSDLLYDSTGSENRREANSDKFLKDWYGSALDVVKFATVDMNSHLIDCLFLGRGILSENNRGTITTKAKLNNNIRDFQEKLYSRIWKYLDSRPNLSEELKQTLQQNLKLYQLDKSGDYIPTRAFERIKTIIDAYLLPSLKMDVKRLLNLYFDYTRGDSQAKSTLLAYNAYAFLSNFDIYLNNLFGKSIEIRDFQKRTGKDKYNIVSKSEGAVSFRDTEPNVEKETGPVIKALINTLPLYHIGKHIPEENLYLTFQNFNHIIGKIKALSINDNVINIVLNKANPIWDTLSQNTRNFVENKRLSLIISEIRVDAPHALCSLFEILNNSKFQNNYKDSIFNEFEPLELDFIWTLHKGIFDTSSQSKNSIINVSDSKQPINYFNFIALMVNTIYNNKFIQIYVDSKGNIKTRELFDTVLDNIKRDIENSINNKLSENFNSLSNNIYLKLILELQIKPIKEGSKTIGISYTIPNTDIVANILFETLEVTFSINDSNLFNSFYLNNDIIKFIDLFTFLNLSENLEYKDKILYFSKGKKSELMRKLLEMTSRIVANQYANINLIKRGSSSYTAILDLVEEIFGIGSFKYDNITKLTLLVSPIDNTFIRNILVKAKASLEGRTTATLINDSTLATQSLQTFSRLIGSITSQWDLIERKKPIYARDANGRIANLFARDPLTGRAINMGSASRDFSILNNPSLFEGYYGSHEFYQPGNTSKKVTDFTVAELVYSGVISNFAPALWKDSSDLYKFVDDGKALFLASVNSDKNMIGYIRSDINTIMPIYDENGTKIGEKAYKDFTPLEHLNLISKEIGTYYANMYLKIEDDFNTLSKYYVDNKILELKRKFPEANDYLNMEFSGFDYGNNFKLFKQWFQGLQLIVPNIAKNAYDFMMDLVLEYNTKHRTNPIEITDLVYVTGEKLQKNETLISQLYTFNPNFLISKIGQNEYSKLLYITDEFGHVLKNENYYTKKEFWELQNSEITRTLINSSFSANLFLNTENNKLLKSYLNDTYGKNTWITKDDYLIYSKFEYKNKIYDISGKADVARIELELGTPINTIINKGLGKFILNPIFEKYNYMDYLITQEWMNSGVGSFVAHPNKAKINGENSLALESSRFLAQHKRNVSWTALMNLELLNELNGIPEYFNISVILDIIDRGTVISGKNNKIKPYDGATFVNPFIAYLENEALGGNRVGLTKKDFCHFKNGQLGTGGIIKTANFPITNDGLRNKRLFHSLFRKMCDNSWIDENGLDVIIPDINISYTGDKIAYDFNENGESGIFFKGKDGNYYKVTRLVRDTSIPNGYKRYVLQVGKKDFHLTIGSEFMMDLDGNVTNNSIIINSNYKLWEAFGGKWSMEPVEGRSTLKPSERSILLVIKAINNIGFDRRKGTTLKPLREETILTLHEIYLPLKHSDIHWLVTEGAIKLGAANVNSRNSYFNAKPLNFLRVIMLLMGPLLDKEHHADNASVSLMTLVMSAAALTGYTTHLAENLYKGLRRVTEIVCKDLFESLTNIANGKAVITNKNKFIEDCTKILIKSLESETSNTFSENLAYSIKKAVDSNLTNYIKAVFPISDNTIFNKAISNFSNLLSKIGIKLKVLGVLAVLNPSFGLYKLYDGRKYDSFNNPVEELELLLLNKENNPIFLNGIINNISDLEMGRTYEIIYNSNYDFNTDFFTKNTVDILERYGDEYDLNYSKRLEYENARESIRKNNSQLNGAIVRITLNPDNYKKIKDLIKENKIARIVEWVKNGRDLGAYNVRFTDGNTKYLLWDLDSIRFKHILKEIDEEVSGIKDISEREKYRHKLFVERVLSEYFNNYGISLSDFYIAKNYFEKLVLKDLERITTKIVPKRTLFNNLIKEYNNGSPENFDLFIGHLKYFIQNDLTESDLLMYLANVSDPNVPFDLTPENISNVLNWIDLSESLRNIVYIDGLKVLVDASSIEVLSYEIIMPKHWIKEFGFDEFTDLNTVKEDPDYFIKLAFRNKNHRLNVYSQEYDIVLENTNGEHYYLIGKKHLDPHMRKANIDTYLDSDGTLWLLDSNGNKIHEILPGTEIYLSNKSDTLIFAVNSTEDIKSYLDILPHNSINLSTEFITDESGEPLYGFSDPNYIIELLETLLDTNKWAKTLLKKSIRNTDIFYNDVEESIPTNEYNKKLALFIRSTLNDWNIVNENNYLEMLANGVINENHPIIKAGRRKYTAFLKSLDIVAARIPAQAMQSFMAMKCVAYDNPNINNAYVSDLLFFLQGSK